MNVNNDFLKEVINLAKHFHSSDTTGHDWWHVHRVWKMAKHIAQRERADTLLVEMAALLHDMDDHKIEGADWQNFPNARKALGDLKIDNGLTERVIDVIKEVSYKGAGVDTTPSTIEACVVQDADRLDALGAIGIARAFAYGGSKNRKIYDPTILPKLHANFEEYKKSEGTTINHFYEKLLLLKDRLNTQTAKTIAAKRHKYMENFLQQFMDEWEINDFD